MFIWGDADEAGHEAVDGLVVQPQRGADLLDQPVLQHHDPVAHGHGLDLVVGDVDHRGLQAVVQGRDLGPHLHAQLGIQVGKRLVEQEHLGLAHDGPAHGHALPLAAGEGLGLAVQQLLDVQDLGRLVHALVDLLLGELADLQPEGHVLVHGHVRVQGVVLEHHGDVPVLGRHVVHQLAVDVELPGGDLLQAGDHAQGGGLAAARRADQHHELLVVDRDAAIIHRQYAALVHFLDVLQLNRSHALPPLKMRIILSKDILPALQVAVKQKHGAGPISGPCSIGRPSAARRGPPGCPAPPGRSPPPAAREPGPGP